MCDLAVDLEGLAPGFSEELDALAPFAADGIVAVTLAVVLLDGMSLVHVHERWTASRGLEFTTTAALSFDAALGPRA